ncbi:MAG: hypothetical protein QXP49_07295, partial [Nitrososphaerota archaeon]
PRQFKPATVLQPVFRRRKTALNLLCVQAFNTIPESYMGRIQAQYGIPIAEWERCRRLRHPRMKQTLVPRNCIKAAGFDGLEPPATIQDSTLSRYKCMVL